MDYPPENVNSVEFKFKHFQIKSIAKISTGFVVETIIFAKVC